MSSQSSEYERLRALWDDESTQLTNEEWLPVMRQMLAEQPDDLDLWWALALKLDFMLSDLRDQGGSAFRGDPMFAEMLSAYDRAIDLNPNDAGGPYNKGRNLERAGLLEDAYQAYMAAGRTEVAHPGDIDWPAAWHFRHAAEVAVELGQPDSVTAALGEAVALCGADDPDVQELLEEFASSAAS